MSQNGESEPLRMKALMLIDDQHGYLYPGNEFFPGYTTMSVSGRNVSSGPLAGWTRFADPEKTAAELCRQRKACYV